MEHFLFSCRTIGMGIEQFIYSHLGFPSLTVRGEVVTPLNKTDCPDWVELEDVWENTKSVQITSDKILVKGPCDVSQIIPFFSNEDMFETEFAYISQEKKGMYIEAFNHSSQVLASLKLTDDEKKMMTETVPFIDTRYYETSIFKVKYDYIIFSLLSDYSLGLYRNKTNPDIVIPFAQYTRDCTQQEDWNYAVSVLMQDGKASELLEKQYRLFQENYEPIGHISDEQLINNLQEIRDRVDRNTTIIFLNGAEVPFKRECKQSFGSYTHNEGDEVSQAQNLSQLVEQDAYAYGFALHVLLHRNDREYVYLTSLPQEAAQPARALAEHYKRTKPELKKYIEGYRQFKPGRNDLCPCGSGKKFKKCHIGKGIRYNNLIRKNAEDFIIHPV